MTLQPDNLNDLLRRISRHIETLLTGIPRLCRFLQKNGDGAPCDEFKILEQIPLQIMESAGRPVVAVAFCGPSGAGKSSVFNLLTGLKVPAGGAVRPMTHVSVVAIPETISSSISLEKMFPGFEVIELGNPAELRNPALPASRLFQTSYQSTSANENLWACLIDVPDFNTTQLANWAKAEQMIRRADSIIFTVYHEAYKSQKTFAILKKVLHLAGNVTWLLTKLDPENCAIHAQEIRDDLLSCASQDSEFQERRADGQTLFDFLKSSPFYFSPYSQTISLDSIQPLANSREDFQSHLFGQQGLKIVLERQLQSIALGVADCEAICMRAQAEGEKAAGAITRVEKHLRKAAERITGEEFPVFLILAMIRKMLDENRPSILRRAFQPLLMAGSGLKKIVSAAGRSLAGLTGRESGSSIMLRNDLERSRLHSEVHKLVEFWRKTPEFSHINAEQCRQVTDQIIATELPAVDSEWEAAVNESLVKWQAGNKNLWIWLNVIDDLFILLGTGLFVADFFLDGGIGTLGVVAAIGGSSATGGFLLSLFNNMGLGKEIFEAHRSWKQMRQATWQKHLGELLAGPLFLHQMTETSNGLSPELISQCREACHNLKEISSKHEIG